VVVPLLGNNPFQMSLFQSYSWCPSPGPVPYSLAIFVGYFFFLSPFFPDPHFSVWAPVFLSPPPHPGTLFSSGLSLISSMFSAVKLSAARLSFGCPLYFCEGQLLDWHVAGCPVFAFGLFAISVVFRKALSLLFFCCLFGPVFGPYRVLTFL